MVIFKKIVLMCNSEVQINYFTEKQCSKMMNCDILLEKNNTNNEKIKPTITKTETRIKSKRGVKQIKTKEKDLINDIISPKKNDGKRKQSQRDKNVDNIQSNQSERIDLQNSSSLGETKSHPKKKPSSRCVKRNKTTKLQNK